MFSWLTSISILLPCCIMMYQRRALLFLSLKSQLTKIVLWQSFIEGLVNRH
jgi:hypothetical protein